MSTTVSTALRTSLPDRSLTPKTVASYVGGVTPVDEVGVTERAAALSTRSVKRESKLAALDLAIRMCDLTTLEGRDTPGKVAQLASKAVQPDPTDPGIPSVAALCVYPNLVPYAVEALAGHPDQLPVIPVVHGDEVVEGFHVVRPHLARPERGDVEPPVRGREPGAAVRRMADVPVAGARGIHGEAPVETPVRQALAEHPFGGGGPADIAETDEQDGGSGHGAGC